ncbi:MAG: hypothetical protein U1E65_26215 [Myxococcota bacterium]
MGQGSPTIGEGLPTQGPKTAIEEPERTARALQIQMTEGVTIMDIKNTPHVANNTTPSQPRPHADHPGLGGHFEPDATHPSIPMDLSKTDPQFAAALRERWEREMGKTKR